MHCYHWLMPLMAGLHNLPHWENSHSDFKILVTDLGSVLGFGHWFQFCNHFSSIRYSVRDIVVMPYFKLRCKSLMDQEWKKTSCAFDVLDILTFSRLILTTDSKSAVCFLYAGLKVSAIILVEYSGTVYWDVRLIMKEAENEHFYAIKILQSFGFCS